MVNFLSNPKVLADLADIIIYGHFREGHYEHNSN